MTFVTLTNFHFKLFFQNQKFGILGSSSIFRLTTTCPCDLSPSTVVLNRELLRFSWIFLKF